MSELVGPEKNFFIGLVDFAFRQSLLKRLVKVLYVIAVLGGGVAVVVCVSQQFQVSPAQGLTALVAGVASYFVWVLISRLLLEIALVLVRIAEGIERATRSAG